MKGSRGLCLEVRGLCAGFCQEMANYDTCNWATGHLVYTGQPRPSVCSPDGLTQQKVVIKQGRVCRAFGETSSPGRAGIVHPWIPQVTNPRDGGFQIGPRHVPSSMQAF